MILDQIINPEAGASSHIWYRAPIIREGSAILVDLSRGQPRDQPYERGEWISCPDWRLMAAAPSGEHWACPHGAAFRRPGNAPAFEDWNAANEHYANPADLRGADEIAVQGIMAEQLAATAFAEGLGRDVRHPTPALDLMAGREVAATARLGVGLYRNAYLWALEAQHAELCRWLLRNCMMAEAMGQLAGVYQWRRDEARRPDSCIRLWGCPPPV